MVRPLQHVGVKSAVIFRGKDVDGEVCLSGWYHATQRFLAVCLLLLCGAYFCPAFASDVLYVYDDLGRVVQVVAPSGSNAQYSYDAAGNITGITNNGASTVAISAFSPVVGPVSTVVTIYGGGFDTTPANNTVSFNGTAATVSSATGNKLVVTVPGGATTGTISVSNTNGSATSATSFTVGAAANQPPTITSFTPTIGTSGTAVTITGTNYQTPKQLNKTTFGTWLASLTSATSTSIVTPVPSAAASGTISVTTPNGSATSSADFYAVPVGLASDVQYTGRLTVDGSAATATTTTNGKKAILIFDGTQGQYVSLYLTSGSFAGTITTSVYSPDGTLFATKTTSNTDRFDIIGSLARVALPMTGTYTVLMTPGGTDKGSITAQVKSAATGSITYNNSTATTKTISAGQFGAFTFVASAMQPGIGVELLNVSISGNTTVTVLLPDGVVLSSATVTTSGGNILPLLSTASGVYRILVQPAATNSGNIDIRVGSPDLVVSGATLGTITATHTGSYSLPVTYTVTNSGSITARPTYGDWCILSSDGTIDATDQMLGGAHSQTSLAPGSNYTTTITCTTSTSTAAGSYTLFLKIDGNTNGPLIPGVVGESNKANNIASMSATLLTLPDLVTSSVSVGTISEAKAGSYSFPVTYTVTNNGGSTAQPSWNDFCYLSADGTLDGSDQILSGANTRSTSLAGGASYTTTITCGTTAATASGTYTLFVRTDGSNNPPLFAGVVAESDETNNTSSVSITLPTKPDLVTSSVSVGTISEAKAGSYSFPVTFTVTNNGASASQPSWNDYCYLSADGTLDASDQVLTGGNARSTSLAGGASYTTTVTCGTTTSTAAGTYTLFVKADGSNNGPLAAGVVAESDETNNTATTSITLPTKPDLVTSSVSVGTIVHNGNGSYSLPVTFTVTNNGSSAAQPSWNDYCYLSTDGTLDSSDQVLSGGNARSTSLAGGASYTTTVTCGTSTTTAAGTYTLFVKADGSNNGPLVAGVVAESDETNNTSTVSVTLP